jgi:phosphatidylethanolamine/phosphatidyl-N-methylethanolamine N-methyltransferase
MNKQYNPSGKQPLTQSTVLNPKIQVDVKTQCELWTATTQHLPPFLRITMLSQLKIKPEFLSAWLRNPRQVGAILPSSGGLTNAMAAQVDKRSGLTIELGAGTGVVTSALLEKGISPEQLVVVEKDKILAGRLAHRFPSLTILEGDAARLQQLLRQSDLAAAYNVVSSLPLLSMRTHTRIRVLSEIFNSLHPDGKLIQFTYSLTPPIPDQLACSLQVNGHKIDRILWNLPPANIWVYRRNQPLSCTIRPGSD